MLNSTAQGATSRHECELGVASDANAAVAACGGPDVRLVVIDLRTSGIDVGSLVPQLRQAGATGLRIMACGPHVHEASLAAAAAAGCDEVVTRGEFERRLDATLASLVRSQT
jgi:CheY-like chemotaxis protein